MFSLFVISCMLTSQNSETTAGTLFTPIVEVSAAGGYQFHLRDQDTLLGAPQFHAGARFHLPFLPGLLAGVKLFGTVWQIQNDTASTIWWAGATVQLGYRLQIGLFDITALGNVGGMLGIATYQRLNQVNTYGDIYADLGLEAGLTFAQQHRIHLSARWALFGEAQTPLSAIALEGGYTLIFGSRAKPPLSIELQELPPLIPPRYRQYPQGKAFQVSVRNDGASAYRNVTAILKNPLSDVQATGPVVGSLPPGQTTQLELASPFGAEVLQIVDEQTLSLELVVRYTVDGGTFEERATLDIDTLPRNSITWDDTRHIGNFLTLRDEEVATYARNVVAAAAETKVGSLTVLDKAMALFHALKSHGIVYNKDPQTPFDTLTASTIDSIQYPRELLRTKAGDCDDLVTLMMTMLESLGIRTAAATIPGHIFMAFDTGISESDSWKLGSNTNQLLTRNGTLWVPLEVTALDRTFEAAWDLGAEQANQPSAELVFASDAMQSFGPATPTFDFQVAFIARGDFQSDLSADRESINQAMQTRALEKFTENRSRAIVQAYFGDLQGAESSLVSYLDSASDDVLALIALSEVYRLQQKLQPALQMILRATEMAPDRVQVWQQLLVVAQDARDEAQIAEARRELEALEIDVSEDSRASEVGSIAPFAHVTLD